MIFPTLAVCLCMSVCVSVWVSAVSVGSGCLARDSDELWYRATVVDLLDDGRYHVMFDLSQREAKLDASKLFPLHSMLLRSSRYITLYITSVGCFPLQSLPPAAMAH